MYSLLVVDDEINVVECLASDIEWDVLGVDEVFKAYSGKQALDLLDENRVDVVIADVKMPEMDGLELAKHIHERWPLAKIIFLSGYGEFEYAQKALQYGVFRYLMKPASYEEILEAVKAALDERERALSKARFLEEANRQLEELRPIARERYMHKWVVYGLTHPLKEPAKAKAYLPFHSTGKAFLALIDTNEFSNGREFEENGMSDAALRSIARETLIRSDQARTDQVIFFQDPEGCLLLLIHAMDEEKLRDDAHYMESMAETFQIKVHDSLGILPSVFWSEPVSLDRLHEVYQKLLVRARRSRVSIPGAIIGLKDHPIGLHDIQGEEPLRYATLTLFVDRLDKDAAIRYVNEAFKALEERWASNYDALLSLYYAISSVLTNASICRGISIAEWAGDGEPRFHGLQRAIAPDQLRQWAVQMLERYVEYMSRRESGETSQLIRQAKRIIERNISNEVSIREIAKRLYIHPNYLSRLFREKEGMCITDYIIRLKMDRAKQLLEEPGCKVWEIAEKIGYKSPAHFTRTFKRLVGMTPSEYQLYHVKCV